MSEPGPNLTLRRLQDLFYRGKFSELLHELERATNDQCELDAELTLLKANTLFELHQVNEAKETLSRVSKNQDGFDEAYLYALARLCYLDDKARDARPIFEDILQHTSNCHYRFKSLLGIANTHYSEGNYHLLPPLLKELHALEPLPRDDEKISLLIFLGNFHLASGARADLAKEYYKKALSAAGANTWTYFITRSLYGMAAVCERLGQTSELMWTLDVLQAFVDQSEQRYYSYVVNDRFKAHFSINTPVEFDTANRRIMVKHQWLPFHDRPLLFQFLLLLHESGTFVDKEQVARTLWPGEGYKPRIHDPRIFDIAKRARGVIEAYEHQPVVLLSGRMGYKLAST